MFLSDASLPIPGLRFPCLDGLVALGSIGLLSCPLVLSVQVPAVTTMLDPGLSSRGGVSWVGFGSACPLKHPEMASPQVGGILPTPRSLQAPPALLNAAHRATGFIV